MKIVVFEGIDCSGKTTLIENFRKSMGGKRSHPLILDRGIHSKYVYGYKVNHIDSSGDLKNAFYNLANAFDVTVVYLDVDPEIARIRMAYKENENFKYTLKKLKELKDYYEESFKYIKCNLIRLDANKHSTDVVKDLMEKIYD